MQSSTVSKVQPQSGLIDRNPKKKPVEVPAEPVATEAKPKKPRAPKKAVEAVPDVPAKPVKAPEPAVDDKKTTMSEKMAKLRALRGKKKAEAPAPVADPVPVPAPAKKTRAKKTAEPAL